MDIAPFITFLGDKTKGRTLRRVALTQLDITTKLMKYRNLEQYKRRMTLADGTVIVCKVQFGLPQITIYVPPRENLVEKQDLDWALLSIVPFFHEGSENANMDAQFIRVRNFKKGPPNINRKTIGDAWWDVDVNVFGNDKTPFYDGVYGHWGPTTPCLLAARSYTWNITGNDVAGTTRFMLRSDYHQICNEIMNIQNDETYTYFNRAMINGENGVACGWLVNPVSLEQSTFRLTARLINPPVGWGSNWVEMKLYCPHGTFTETSAYAYTWSGTAYPSWHPIFKHSTLGYLDGVYYTDCELIGSRFSSDPPTEALLKYTQDKAWDFDPMKLETVSKQFVYKLFTKYTMTSEGTFNHGSSTAPRYEYYKDATVQVDFLFPLSSGEPIQGSRTYSGCAIRFDYAYSTNPWPPPHDTWIYAGISNSDGTSFVDFTITCTNTPVGIRQRLLCFYDWTDAVYPWKTYDRVKFFTGTVAFTGSTASYSATGIITTRIFNYRGEAETVYEESVTNVNYIPMNTPAGILKASWGNFVCFTDGGVNDPLVGASHDSGLVFTGQNNLPGLSTTQMYDQDNQIRLVQSLGGYVPDKRQWDESIQYEQRHKTNEDPSLIEFDAGVKVFYDQGKQLGIKMLGMPRKEWRWAGNARVINLASNWKPAEG